MKICFLILAGILSINDSFGQIDKIITELEVLRVEKTLSSNEMAGRKPGTPGIEKAAEFLSNEFHHAGLSFLPGLESYRQEFSSYRNKQSNASITFDGETLDSKNLITFGNDQKIEFDNVSSFEKVLIPADSNLLQMSQRLLDSRKSYFVIVDTAHVSNFRKIRRLNSDPFSKRPAIIFLLTSKKAERYNVAVTQEISEIKMTNIVGMIPGKSLPNEYVIFSGHYDHLGIGKPNASGDSIFNGANDDAAGTTAVIMLSKYFSNLKNNERSLIFVAFTAEESGGFGSRYFSSQLDPKSIVAMFNIEMIGTESKWGTNSTYITGYEKSDLGEILEKNLEGSKFKFYPDPYPAQQLFYRSDNATLAALGVPAHTISTAKMDQEPYYHSADDEIETLDLQNMTEIIKAIAISSTGLVNGKDTPSRVEEK